MVNMTKKSRESVGKSPNEEKEKRLRAVVSRGKGGSIYMIRRGTCGTRVSTVYPSQRKA
jgi:hypothetical protein